jgi:hypothetical protein
VTTDGHAAPATGCTVALPAAGETMSTFIIPRIQVGDYADEARRRLEESGVLDRFANRHGPDVVEEASR